MYALYKPSGYVLSVRTNGTISQNAGHARNLGE
jgi:hypothetical protein